MILVDSSVWIDHFRSWNATFASLMVDERVLMHPVVIGELLLGGLPTGTPLRDLQDMTAAAPVDDGEVLLFIQRHSLTGADIGYGDAHLLASAQLTTGATLWTRDRRLRAAAQRLGLDADIEPYGGLHEE